MLNRLLSNDFPRSRLLGAILVLLFLALAFQPFLIPGIKALNVAAKVLVFIVLVASFDLLLGYTGIVSFAHTMFFGIGAYGVAIATNAWGPSWSAVITGALVALGLSAVLALAIALFSLRVRAIFFAMITLAMAAAFQTLASQLSEITGGEDGLNFRLPELLKAVAGEIRNAEVAYRKAIEIDPDFSPARYQLGRLLLARAGMLQLGADPRERDARKPDVEKLAGEATREIERALTGGRGFEDPLHRAVAS